MNIGSVVNVPEVKEYAQSLPNVVVADENLFTCSQDTQEKMKHLINEYDLNRVVVASCSPRTHEFLFRTTIREAGLNKYLFEMANIRDQCSWVHMKDKEKATKKAKTLVRMAVTNANYIKPLKEVSIGVNKRALVVGGGLAGMTAALKFARQNFEVYLVEKESGAGRQPETYPLDPGRDGRPGVPREPDRAGDEPPARTRPDGDDRRRPFRLQGQFRDRAPSRADNGGAEAEAWDDRGGYGRRRVETQGPVRLRGGPARHDPDGAGGAARRKDAAAGEAGSP